MDRLEKLTRELPPLGGDLLLDRFLSALGEAAVKSAPRMATRTDPPAETRPPRAPEPLAAKRAVRPPRHNPMGDEVDDFMNRDAIEGTSDDEVQEFLKERSGFDPTGTD